MHPKLHRSSIKLFIFGDLKKVQALMGIYFELLSSKMSIKFLDDATSCQILFVTEKERKRERIQTDRQIDRQKNRKIRSC